MLFGGEVSYAAHFTSVFSGSYLSSRFCDHWSNCSKPKLEPLVVAYSAMPTLFQSSHVVRRSLGTPSIKSRSSSSVSGLRLTLRGAP